MQKRSKALHSISDKAPGPIHNSTKEKKWPLEENEKLLRKKLLRKENEKLLRKKLLRKKEDEKLLRKRRSSSRSYSFELSLFRADKKAAFKRLFCCFNKKGSFFTK